jgi:hypothetical protein
MSYTALNIAVVSGDIEVARWWYLFKPNDLSYIRIVLKIMCLFSAQQLDVHIRFFAFGNRKNQN